MHWSQEEQESLWSQTRRISGDAWWKTSVSNTERVCVISAKLRLQQDNPKRRFVHLSRKQRCAQATKQKAAGTHLQNSKFAFSDRSVIRNEKKKIPADTNYLIGPCKKMEPRRKLIARSQELLRVTPDDTKAERNDDDDEIGKHQSSTLAWRFMNWIEAQELPKCIVRRRGNSPGENIYIISGLKKVFYGTQPAAEVVRVAGVRPPRYLCYMVSGSCCDVIQFLMYIFFYKLQHNPTMCWALSFVGSIVFRHTTHRYLVFGNYVGGYWQSLGRMYAGYSIIIVLSTLFNRAVAYYLDISHLFAWILTLLWTGIVNFLILKKIWSFDGSKKEGKIEKIEVLPRATVQT